MKMKDVSPTDVNMKSKLGLIPRNGYANSFSRSPRSGIVAEDDIAMIEEQKCKREAYLGLCEIPSAQRER